MDKTFKVAVVGCGNISRTHLSVLNGMDNIELVAVCDTVREKANLCAERYGCKAYYEFEKLLSNEKLDCVHICTPHYLHVPMSIKALECGVNVLCEKPCAISKEELKRLKTAVESCCAVYGVCFQNRYNPSVKEALRLIESGELGTLKAERANVDWFRDEKYYSDAWHGKKALEGGGVLMNQAIHTSDLLRVFSRSETAKIEARVFNDSLKGIIEVEDSAMVRYTYKNGVVAVLSATNGFSLNADVSIELIFDSGAVLRLEGQGLYLSKNNEGFKELTPSCGENCCSKSYWGNGHVALIRDFYSCLEDGRRFSVDFEQGAKAVFDVLAAYESSEKAGIH